ncbi:MAG: formylglycine-generating enzyme family protein, partial [Deltaproteobacteria bacterium]|nr:formylglycine-generating enzyme family protein [Deltaproteobacteria bacterium]
ADSPAPVKKYPPNAWGLYDMHGNVWEWCRDWFGEYPSEHVTDPLGPSKGEYRVGRGGAFFRKAQYCRSAVRYIFTQGYGYDCVGFRLVRIP